MKQEKWEKRDKKLNKRRYGMRIDGASCKVLEQVKRDKADAIKAGK